MYFLEKYFICSRNYSHSLICISRVMQAFLRFILFAGFIYVFWLIIPMFPIYWAHVHGTFFYLMGQKAYCPLLQSTCFAFAIN